MTYRCDRCAEIFDEPSEITESDYIDTGIGLSWAEYPIGSCCPECGCEEYIELEDEECDTN